APVRCAIEIAQAVRDVPSMRLRMGIHTGPVLRGEDINAAANVAGGGVNIARRGMDCGDAGHILLSSTVAEILAQLKLWDGCLHDLGECEVKHGARLHLVNFYTPEAGNPSPPSALRRDPAAAVAPVATPEGSADPAQAVAPADPGQQIALLY